MEPPIVIEGKPYDRYYFLTRIWFLLCIGMLVYVTYYVFIAYFDIYLLGLFILFFLLVFLLYSFAIFHNNEKRRIVIHNNNLQYFVGDELKNEIQISDIKKVRLYTWSSARVSPIFLTGKEDMIEKNILINYTEKSKRKNLRLYYVDFCPLDTLDLVYNELDRVSNYFGFKVADKRKSFLENI
jgi:hypothetical protein